jgi:ferrochelatase
VSVAVVLMAYGSPERLADVPAYYADIRGGRPIAPERLEDLVERYRRLGIEDSNPLNEITEATRAALEAELRFVERWGAEQGFVELLAGRVEPRKDAHVVFTAHSLPARILEQDDPYRDELLETSRLVAERAGAHEWTFAFQSESPTGEPWLGPDILEHLNELAATDVRDVLLCPVGFVADHLEIRWDLDVEAAGRARELGIRLERIELPNADPAFVRVLAGLVRRAAAVPSAG